MYLKKIALPYYHLFHHDENILHGAWRRRRIKANELFFYELYTFGQIFFVYTDHLRHGAWRRRRSLATKLYLHALSL